MSYMYIYTYIYTYSYIYTTCKTCSFRGQPVLLEGKLEKQQSHWEGFLIWPLHACTSWSRLSHARTRQSGGCASTRHAPDLPHLVCSCAELPYNKDEVSADACLIFQLPVRSWASFLLPSPLRLDLVRMLRLFPRRQ